MIGNKWRSRRLALGIGGMVASLGLVWASCTPGSVTKPGTPDGVQDSIESTAIGTRAKGEEGSMGTPLADEAAPAPEGEKREALSAAPKADEHAARPIAPPADAKPRALKHRSPSRVPMGSIAQGFGAGGGALGITGSAPFGAPHRAPPAFNTESYQHVAESEFLQVQDKPLSTFSVDVDTASYSNLRRFLADGQLPPADAVRIEEMLNYFSYNYPAPTGATPFAVHSEVSEAPWNPKHKLVRIGIQAKEMAPERVPARNLVFLVDVSGSMQSGDKLPLLKRGLDLLAQDLRPNDRISIAVYAGASGLVLPSTSGSSKDRVRASLARLEAGGSTNGAEGIELAYRVAQENFIQGGINRVILATDGDFNVGVTSHGDLVRLIENKRKSGVFLTVLGFGRGNLKDSTMESLADKGNGNYAYIDSLNEAHKVLVREAGATLVTVAKDVKLQVEFNPRVVASYRLIGYENRALQDRDFNDDTKDAGEVGAGHSVTALYEVVPTGSDTMQPGGVDALKYQGERKTSALADAGELLTVKVRYKQPAGNTSTKLEFVVNDRDVSIAQSSADQRFSAAVAAFGMLLRNSKHKGNVSLANTQSLARGALGADAGGYREELLAMMRRADELGL